MFSGLRVQGPQTSVDATSVSDLKNLKALHNNEDITVTIRLEDFIEVIESLVAGGSEDEVYELQAIINGQEDEIENLESELDTAMDNQDELEMDIANLEDIIEELEAELVSVHSELDEAHAMIDDNE